MSGTRTILLGLQSAGLAPMIPVRCQFRCVWPAAPHSGLPKSLTAPDRRQKSMLEKAREDLIAEYNDAVMSLAMPREAFRACALLLARGRRSLCSGKVLPFAQLGDHWIPGVEGCTLEQTRTFRRQRDLLLMIQCSQACRRQPRGRSCLQGLYKTSCLSNHRQTPCANAPSQGSDSAAELLDRT